MNASRSTAPKKFFHALALVAALGSVPGARADGATATEARLRNDGKTMHFEYLDPSSTTQNPVWIEYETVKTYPVGTRFYHWGPTADIKGWASRGISESDIRRSADHYDATDAAGGGFYMSIDPYDSAEYGPNQLIAEPKHAVVALSLSNNSFSRDGIGFMDTSRKNLIPTAVIARAGVEMLQYGGNWHVAIRSTPLERLFEASWKDFISRAKPGSGLAAFLTFTAKYPPPANFASDPAVAKAFPIVARVLGKSDGSAPYTKAEVTQLYDDIRSNSWLLTSVDAGKKIMKKLVAELRAPMTTVLAEKLKAFSTQGFDTTGSMWALQSDLTQVAPLFGLTLHDIDPGYPINPGSRFPLPTPSSSPGVTPPTSKPSRYVDARTSVDSSLSQSGTLVDFFVALAEVIKGNQYPWIGDDVSAEQKANPSNFYSGLYSATNGLTSGLMERIANYLSPNKAELRDFPLFADGDVKLDGPDKPGYFIVDARERGQLEKTRFASVQFKAGPRDASGKVSYYARIEHASARNWKKIDFIAKGPLAARLEAAEHAGLLKDPKSDESRGLTLEIVRALASYWISDRQSSANVVSEYLRLRPFADADTNRRVLRGLANSRGFTVPLMLRGQGMTPTAEEMIESQTYVWRMQSHFSRYSLGTTPTDLASGTDRILDRALGIWEVAANDPSPKSDPDAFIKRVRAEFSSSRVQALLKAGRYEEITAALHKAGRARGAVE